MLKNLCRLSILVIPSLAVGPAGAVSDAFLRQALANSAEGFVTPLGSAVKIKTTEQYHDLFWAKELPAIAQEAIHLLRDADLRKPMNPGNAKRFVREFFVQKNNFPELEHLINNSRMRQLSLAAKTSKPLDREGTLRLAQLYLAVKGARETTISHDYLVRQRLDDIHFAVRRFLEILPPQEAGIARQAFIAHELLRRNPANPEASLNKNDVVQILSQLMQDHLLEEIDDDKLRHVLSQIQNVFTDIREGYNAYFDAAFPELTGQKDVVLDALMSVEHELIAESSLASPWNFVLNIANHEYDSQNLPINPHVVQSYWMRSGLARSWHDVWQWLVKAGYPSGSVVYPFSGSDISTALLMTNAHVLRFYDALPFERPEPLPRSDAMHRVYLNEKTRRGMNSQSVMNALGGVRIPLLWELEAIGAVNIQNPVPIKGEAGAYAIEFDWSYDGVSAPEHRRLEYRQKKFDINALDLSDILDPARNDIYLTKANFALPLATSAWPPVMVSFAPLAKDDDYLQRVLTQGYNHLDLTGLAQKYADPNFAEGKYPDLIHLHMMIKRPPPQQQWPPSRRTEESA